MPDETQQPGWTYKPGETPASSSELYAEPEYGEPAEKKHNLQPVSWAASEFIAHHKSAGWYMAFLLVIGVCAGLIYVLTQDIISATVIIIAGILFAILAARKPRQVSYYVDHNGVNIGGKFYSFAEFKSFGVSQEGAIRAINLLPLKRFMPEVTIYYPPEQEVNILSLLSQQLPHEQLSPKGVDQLLKKLRF